MYCYGTAVCPYHHETAGFRVTILVTTVIMLGSSAYYIGYYSDYIGYYIGYYSDYVRVFSFSTVHATEQNIWYLCSRCRHRDERQMGSGCMLLGEC
jgi:hypothetical protein